MKKEKTHKVCFTCKKNKKLNKFYSNKARTNKVYGSCIECLKKKRVYPKSSDLKIKYLDKDLKKERWEKIIIYNKTFPYKISDCGRVLIERRNKIAKPSFDERGYPQIVLTLNGYRVGRRIHLLVGRAFIPNPLKLREANHKDGDKLFPHYKNLEWNTSKDNTLHAFKLGLKKPFTSANHPRSKPVINSITKEKFNSIGEASKSAGLCYTTLAEMLSGKLKNDTNFKYATK